MRLSFVRSFILLTPSLSRHKKTQSLITSFCLHTRPSKEHHYQHQLSAVDEIDLLDTDFRFPSATTTTNNDGLGNAMESGEGDM